MAAFAVLAAIVRSRLRRHLAAVSLLLVVLTPGSVQGSPRGAEIHPELLTGRVRGQAQRAALRNEVLLEEVDGPLALCIAYCMATDYVDILYCF